jgi:flagellar protein FliO/FliZ
MSLPISPFLAVAAAHSESQPLDLSSTTASAHAASGGSIARTIVGLAIVIAVIYGLYWVLKLVKSSREETVSGSGLSTLATLPLGPNRSLHLVRAGGEVVLLGVGEGGVTPIRSYGEHEARALGLLGPGDIVVDVEAESHVLPALTGKPMANPTFGASLRRSLADLRNKTVIR